MLKIDKLQYLMMMQNGSLRRIGLISVRGFLK